MGRKLKGRKNPPSFFKVLIGDFWNKLRVPTAFVKNINGRVPKKVILISSTRRSWLVSIKMVGKDLFLCDEWQTFVKHHALEFGEILVFKYVGNSEFHVTIFGLDACKRDSSSAMKNRRNDKAAVTDKMTSVSIRQNAISPNNDIAEELEVVHSFNTTFAPSKRYRVNVPRWLVKEQRLGEQDSMMLLDPCGRSWPVKIFNRRNRETFLGAGWAKFCITNRINPGDICRFEFTKRMNNAIRVDIFRKSVPIAEHAKKPEDYYSDRTMPEPRRKQLELAPQREERTIAAAAGFTSNYPFCNITMRSTFVGRPFSLGLRFFFAKKYLKGAPRDVRLRVSNGRTWIARYTGEPYHRLVAGWKAFALDNHLKENDVCVFELVDQDHIELKVSIICN